MNSAPTLQRVTYYKFNDFEGAEILMSDGESWTAKVHFDGFGARIPWELRTAETRVFCDGCGWTGPHGESLCWGHVGESEVDPVSRP